MRSTSVQCCSNLTQSIRDQVEEEDASGLTQNKLSKNHQKSSVGLGLGLGLVTVDKGVKVRACADKGGWKKEAAE